MAPVCLPSLHHSACDCHPGGQLLLLNSCEGVWQEQHILATLFLLSYSKALETIISALSATQVLTSDADNVSAPVLPYTVWSEYLKGKHVVLFTVALVFLLVFFLPYTLLLTFGQCLRSLPVRRRRILRLTCSKAFIFIMDAYHAPYNCYWTGLMLLTRCVLFLAFAINYSSEKVLVNSYISSLLITGLLLIKTVSTKIYRAPWMNILEISFLCNLEVLLVTVCYIKGSTIDDSVICTIRNASVTISLITFIGIVAYHAYLLMHRTRWYLSCKQAVSTKSTA